MYVLMYHHQIPSAPIAAAERSERLNEEMARYTAAQQAAMTITEVDLLE